MKKKKIKTCPALREAMKNRRKKLRKSRKHGLPKRRKKEGSRAEREKKKRKKKGEEADWNVEKQSLNLSVTM